MEAGAGLHHTGRRLGGAKIALALIAAGLLGVGVGVGAHFLFATRSPPSPGPAAALRLDGEATWAAGTRTAPAITTLRDQSGRLFSLASLRGRPVAMEFFDSRC